MRSFLAGPLNSCFLEKLGSGNLADIESHDLPPASATTDSWSRGRVNVVKRINHEIQSRSQSRVSAGINVAFPPSTIGDTDSNGMMAPSARPNILEHQEERTYQEHMSRANTERTDETLPTIKSMQKQTEETNITRTKNVSPYQVFPQPNCNVLPARGRKIPNPFSRQTVTQLYPHFHSHFSVQKIYWKSQISKLKKYYNSIGQGRRDG